MNQYNPELHHRRSIRLREYDYTQAGAYFVTLCVQGRECLLGEINDGSVKLSRIGELIRNAWHNLPTHFPHIALDEFVIMPNHLHAILILSDRARRGEAFAESSRNETNLTANASPSQQHPNGTKPHSLNAVLQNFKSVSTRRVNQFRKKAGVPFWQRDYYEHIIRDDRDLQNIREYIRNNPYHWSSDEYNA